MNRFTLLLEFYQNGTSSLNRLKIPPTGWNTLWTDSSNSWTGSIVSWSLTVFLHIQPTGWKVQQTGWKCLWTDRRFQPTGWKASCPKFQLFSKNLLSTQKNDLTPPNFIQQHGPTYPRVSSPKQEDWIMISHPKAWFPRQFQMKG